MADIGEGDAVVVEAEMDSVDDRIDACHAIGLRTYDGAIVADPANVTLAALGEELLEGPDERAFAQLKPPLTVAVDDPRAVKIVRRNFNADAVTGEDSNPVATHLACYVAEDQMAIVEFDAKHRVWQRLNYVALELDFLFFGHQR